MDASDNLVPRVVGLLVRHQGCLVRELLGAVDAGGDADGGIAHVVATARGRVCAEVVGFIFGHFFGVFLATTPHFDNVTDDHRYSRLLADFPSVGVGVILTVRFLKKGPFDFLGGLFEGLRAPSLKAKSPIFLKKQT